MAALALFHTLPHPHPPPEAGASCFCSAANFAGGRAGVPAADDGVLEIGDAVLDSGGTGDVERPARYGDGER